MRRLTGAAVAVALSLTAATACTDVGGSVGGVAAQQAPGAASSCTVPAKLVGKDLVRLPLSTKHIALTFDAGANGAGVPSIRKTLREKKVPATFFLTGRFVEVVPKKSANIGREHLVGNHTRTHPDLTTLTDDEVRAEVKAAQKIITEGTGQDPRRFFRFPFGARNARTIALINDLCYVAFRWTVDTLGWKGTSGGMTVAAVVGRVLDAAKPGAIVLMHVGSNPDDGSTLDADALPRIIKKLRARGYSFVRLSKVMSAAP